METVKEKLQIPQEIDLLDEYVAKLDSIVGDVITRLQPICTPYPKDSGEQNKVKPSRAPLADKIADTRERISRIIDAIGDARERFQI